MKSSSSSSSASRKRIRSDGGDAGSGVAAGGRLAAVDDERAVGLGDRAGVVGRAGVGDDDLIGRQRLTRQRIEQVGQPLGFVERGDDDGERG